MNIIVLLTLIVLIVVLIIIRYNIDIPDEDIKDIDNSDDFLKPYNK